MPIADLGHLVLAPSRDVADSLALAFDETPWVPDEIVRAAIFDTIERSYQLGREEFPEKLEIFPQALQGLMGAGGKVKEKLIAKSLYRRLELNFKEHGGWTLIDYVSHVKETKRDEWRHH